MSTYFRFLNRRGGYTWMQMCATLVCNTKNENEQSIICVNYVLSGNQYGHVVMDSNQVREQSRPNIFAFQPNKYFCRLTSPWSASNATLTTRRHRDTRAHQTAAEVYCPLYPIYIYVICQRYRSYILHLIKICLQKQFSLVSVCHESRNLV